MSLDRDDPQGRGRLPPRPQCDRAVEQFLGSPGTPAVGWIAHFVIGGIAWGLLFAAAGRQAVAVTTLVLHLIYGVVLGATFAGLVRRQGRIAPASTTP